jgi:hypothetical protein
MNTVHERCALAALTLCALPAFAHHSPAMFDMSQELVLEGTVTEFSWRNPHVYMAIEVAGPDGTPHEQRIEAGPASNLVPLGVSADSIRRGDRVVVHARPNRAGPGHVVLGMLLTKSDGTQIPLHVRAIGPSAPGAAETSTIAGTWVPQAAGFTRLGAAVAAWPLTEKGRAAIVSTAGARVAARSECVPFGPPAIMSLPGTTIVEVGDREVRFTLDVMNVERIVHLDQAKHPADAQPSLFGHSIGHWEGETLVVDTVGFAAHPEGYAFDHPSSAAKHLVERFTVNADRKHLDYEALVEDPEYLAAPVTHRAQWDYRPEQRPSGLPCDPEVARRFTTGE